MDSSSILRALDSRQSKPPSKDVYSSFSGAMFDRLTLEVELKSHKGCVNCLQWNKSGELLASGSDDTNIVIWRPGSHVNEVHKIPTLHRNNIFSVKFINNERQLITGSGDTDVRHIDIARSEILSVFRCHDNRVKRCCVLNGNEHVVISSAEDGTVREFDIREAHVCTSTESGCDNVIVSLPGGSIKSINSNPVRPDYIAVGAHDDVARVYDRRMISRTSKELASTHQPVKSFIPGHLRYKVDLPPLAPNSSPSYITYLTFDPTGTFLLCNMGFEQLYLYNVVTGELQRDITLPSVSPDSAPCCQELDPKTVELKSIGNNFFKQRNFITAVTTYSECLKAYPNNVFLLNNRALALLKRGWKGDQYAAYRDTTLALHNDPSNEKAAFRQIQALQELGFNKVAWGKIKQFKATHHSSDVLKGMLDTVSSAIEGGAKDPEVTRPEAVDYEKRYCGHCNATTDIKEANFFGPNNEYIMAGSDDKNFFFWDRISGSILKVYQGDNDLVNCLQPHPYLPLIATSGIEDVVKIWSPAQSDMNHVVYKRTTQLSDISAGNQKLMKTMSANQFVLGNEVLGDRCNQS